MSRERKLPAVPAISSKVPREIAQVLGPLKQIVEALQQGGIVSASGSTSAGSSGADAALPATVVEALIDSTTPPAPTGVAAQGGMALIIVSFDKPSYRNHAYTEVWRADSNDFSQAVLVGTTQSTAYTDSVGGSRVAWYWLRHVSSSTPPRSGPFNSQTGSRGETGMDATYLQQVLAGKITENQLALGSVNVGQIVAGAVDITRLAAGIRPTRVVAALPALPAAGWQNGDTAALTSDGKLYRIVSGVWRKDVDAADIAGQVTNAQIAGLAASKVTGQLTDAQIAAVAAAKVAGQIVGTQITDGAISTDKLTANAVTANELAAGAVVAGKIAAGSVTANELAAGSVIASKIASLSVQAQHIQAGAIVADKLAAGAITAVSIKAGEIQTSHFAPLSVTTEKLAAESITAAKLAAQSVTADKLVAQSVTAEKISAGAVTADKLSVGSLSAISANIGTVTAGTLRNSAGSAYVDLNASGAAPFISTAGGFVINADGSGSIDSRIIGNVVTGQASVGVRHYGNYETGRYEYDTITIVHGRGRPVLPALWFSSGAANAPRLVWNDGNSIGISVSGTSTGSTIVGFAFI